MPISDPDHYQLSPLEVFYTVVSSSPFSRFLKGVLQLTDHNASSIDTVLQDIPKDDFAAFVHLFHLTLFVQKSHSTSVRPDSFTPVTDAVKGLISVCGLEAALRVISSNIIDVLTAHPVDMDRGVISAYKQDYEILSQKWVQKKHLYSLLTDIESKLLLRAELNEIHLKLKNTSRQLLHTSNYRQQRIRPESEQRHLSRAVKDYESAIVAHWSKLLTLVQVLFLKELLSSLIAENAVDDKTVSHYLNASETDETFNQLSEIPQIQAHPLFPLIMQIKDRLSYEIETWRGDMDGNPFVNSMTVAMSTAYGRKRCFERLSADDAVIRYQDPSDKFSALSAELERELATLEQSGQAAWQRYIKQQQVSGWGAVQIYSGLAYYRMVELTEAAELFLREPTDLSLLKKGFASSEEFLAFTQPLEDIETCVGIEKGVWSYYRRVVRMRQLSLGRTHVRKGERQHLDVILDLATALGLTPSTPFESLSDTEQQQLVKTCIAAINEGKHHQVTLSEPSIALLTEYQAIMKIDETCVLIQSDSGDLTQSSAGSLLVLNAISALIGHRGKSALLCESEQSVNNAIDFMNKEGDSGVFKDVIMMCAGSDSQKKMGPFYSAYLIHQFFKTGYEQQIETFFGAGDSPLRSSLHVPVSLMRTFQPGSRKRHYFGARIYPYLSNRLADHIKGVGAFHQKEPELSDDNLALFKQFGECMFKAYQTAIDGRDELCTEIQSLSTIVTTYFSRPSKKSVQSGRLLDQIRAIDSGRAQLILNAFDPQLAGLREGIDTFLSSLDDVSRAHQFFNQTSAGRSILETLAFFAEMLDDDLPSSTAIRTVSHQDIISAYQSLSGRALTVRPDKTLRLVRQFWAFASKNERFSEQNPQTLMLFGANWMI